MMLPAIESYFSVLMLFGFSQAVLSIYLLLKDNNRPYSNNMLALLLITWGFSCYWFFAYIWKGALFSVAVTTFIGPMLALTLFPPIFLYVKYIFYNYKGFQKIDHLHFLPIYLYLIFTFYMFADSDFSIAKMREHEWYNLRRIICAYLATIQGPFYFFFTNRILKLWHQNLEKDYSDIENRKLEWFKIINYSFALVFILGGISTILRSNLINPYYLYMAYHGIIALSLFYIALMIYKYPLLFTRSEKFRINEYSEKEASKSESFEVEETIETEIALDEKDKNIIEKIKKVMKEQKLYKNPNFSLNDLSEAISESRNSISAALNQSLNKTFYQYINECRIEEASDLLADKSLLNYSIEGIATQSGFKSMSVFYRFFKEIHSVTPAVYRKNLMGS
jgi:AraC-like DNA-binding protein